MPESAPDAHPRDRLKRELHLRDATLLIVSGVIGSGIFFTPGAIADLLPHPGLILAAWMVGGVQRFKLTHYLPFVSKPVQ